MSSATRTVTVVLAGLGWVSAVFAQGVPAPRKLGEMEVRLLGLSAGVEPLEPVVPKNVAAGVRIVVRAGGRALTALEVQQLVGGPFEVQGELSGPGLAGTLSLPQTGPGAPPVPDPLMLGFPGLPRGGDYELSNLRLVQGGRIVLDVTPRHVTIRVIDQILVTSVQTQALTLDEIRARGIVLDADSYLGFQFTVQVLVESTPVQLDFPVVFDREGVALPLPLQPPPEPLRTGTVVRAPLMVPVLLAPRAGSAGGGGDLPPLSLPDGQLARIPSLLVIPGNVGYLKQFFSAQLVVANGAPPGSGLVVRNVTGTIVLPAGADGVPGNADDPLTLPATESGPQSPTQAVLREDGTGELLPGEQGRAEFTLRGEKEGFHALAFELAADLDGLAVGTVAVSGAARGGVLVRNAYLDTSFTLPSVVRAEEEFSAFVTVTNVGQGTAYDVDVSLDATRLSGATLLSSATQTLDELTPGDARTLEYRFRSRVTGQVAASYLRFDTNGGTDVTGRLNFTLGVGERGVALSPDTLVLPTAVDALPATVVRAAMRVLGQAWSAATAPVLPAGVEPITTATVTRKALALAEAGLRVKLRGSTEAARRDALRELLLDLHAGQDGVDAGFDQLLRTTRAGAEFDAALGALLAAPLSEAGGALEYERQLAELASSGAPFVSFAVEGAGGALAAEVTLLDAQGRRLGVEGPREVPGALLVRAGAQAGAPLVGFAAFPGEDALTLQINGADEGAVDVSITVPGPDGDALRAEARGVGHGAASRARLVFRPTAVPLLELQQDAEGDGVYETVEPLVAMSVDSAGPRLLAAVTVGPETITGATPLGVYAALLFDRVVDAAEAGDVVHYELEHNAVRAARRQLSGRLVFVALEQPEGPLVPVAFDVVGLHDAHGRGGARQSVVMGSRLETPGAVVSGRVLQADGTPVGGARVVYGNVWSAGCTHTDWTGVATQETDDTGRFEFRYVLQSPCGSPFRLDTRDPLTGAARGVKLFVQTSGQRLVADLVLLGHGSVAGRVWRGDGSAAPGARVRVASLSDAQVAGLATADANGDYLVRNMPVGGVSVTAVLGAHLGRAAGNISTAGSTAQVPVSLDGDVTFTGSVYKLQDGVLTVVPGIDVVYYHDGVALGLAVTDTHGQFELAGMPPGDYQLHAALNARDHQWVTGVSAAGQTVVQNLVISVLASSTYGTVQGHVRLPNGAAAAGAWVSDGSAAATIADTEGAYELTGVSIRAGAQTIHAVSADGRRAGTASVVVSAAGQVVSGVDIQLSGLGRAEFYVLDAAGQPLVGQTVALTGSCLHPCGCRFASTDANGVARFDDVPLGNVGAKAVRVVGGVSVDAATGSALVSDEDVPGAATLRFQAPGAVSVSVTQPGGGAAVGADVQLTSLSFVNDGVFTCGLVSKVTQTGRTDAGGTIAFQGVHVGGVSVAVSSFALPTVVSASGVLAEGGVVPFAVQLVDTLAGELSGLVLLPDGSGAVGAGVEVTASGGGRPDVTVTTDTEGRYRFASVLPAGTYLLTARDVRPSGTGSVAQIRVALAVGVASTHDLRLKERGSVRVTVVDGAGVVVDAALVRVRESDFPGLTQELPIVTAAQQPVEFTGVYEGPLTVEASDALGRGGRASAVLPPGGQAVEVTVRLTTTGHVRGHFYLPDGVTAIPNATVKLVSGYRVIGQVTTLADSDVGSFGFDYVPAGTVRLEAEDPRTGRMGVATGTLDSEGQLVLLDVRAQALGRVQGEVTLNQQPQPSAEVTLRTGGYHVRVTSDSAGQYAVDGVPEGQISATGALGGSFLLGTAAGVLAGEGQTLDLPIALRGAGSIDGQLLDADGVSAGRVSAITLNAFGSRQTTTSDAAGHFHFDLVPEGPVELIADALQSIDCARESYSVTGGETLQAPLHLHGVGALDGSVTDGVGPVAGRVTIVGTATGPGCAPGWGITLQVGSSGLFTVPEMVAGPVTLSFTNGPPAGPWLYASAADNVVAGATTQVALQLEASGSVQGVVHHEGGGASIGAGVTIVATQGRWLSSQTRADGSFLVRGVPAGPVTVLLRDTTTGGLARATGTVADDATLDLGTITLTEAALSVVSTAPLQGAVDVPTGTVVTLAFSAPLQHTGGIAVLVNGLSLGFTSALTSEGLSVSPSGAWPDSSEIEMQANGYVTDVLGRHLGQPFSLRFRTVDLSPPRVKAVAPAHQSIEVAPDTAVSVSFDESIVTSGDLQPLVQVSGLAGAVSGTVTAVSPTTLVFAPAAPWPTDGVYTVTVNGATDLSGHVQTVAFTSTFATLDTVPPNVIPWAPLPDVWMPSARPSFLFGASDATSGPATSATLDLDGQTHVVPNSIPGWYYYYPLVDLSDGLHSYTATVRDRAGNTNNFTASFGVDTQAPTQAAFVGLTDGQIVSGTVRLRGTASDAGAGLKYGYFYRGAVSSGGALEGTTTYYYDWPTVWDADGPYVLTTKAVDFVGHVSPLSAPLTLYVNNHVLTTSIVSPAAGTSVRDQVSVAATVSESVQRVEFQAAGLAPVSDDTPPYTATLDLTALPEGATPITVTAYGIVPGETAVAGVTIEVDRTAPAAPDASRISAGSDGGTVLVFGQAGAVEGGARVEAVNPAAGSSGFVAASASDGSFVLQLAGLLGHVITLAAVDSAGNRSPDAQVTVADGYTEQGVPLAGLQLWVESDTSVTSDAGGFVSRWADLSGNGNDLVQAVAAEQPQVQSAQVSAEVSGPVLHFDGSNDSLALTTRLDSVGTVLAVVVDREEGASQYRLLFGDASSASKPFFGGAPALWHGSYASQDVINGDTRLDGVAVVGTTQARPRSFAVLSVQPRAGVPIDRLGRHLLNGAPWWGDVAALLVYDRALSAAAYKSAEDYLARRYKLYVPQVAQPQITPYGGTFSGATTLTLSTRTPGAQIRYTLNGSEPDAASTLYDGPLVLSASATVKAKAFLAGATDSTTAVAGFVETSANSPARVPGLVFWARADAAVTASRAGLVSRWGDLSDRHNDLVQPSATEQPLFTSGAANGLPALRFDGTNDSLVFTTPITDMRTVVALLRESPTQATHYYRSLFGAAGTANRPFYGGAPALWHGGMSSASVRNGQVRLGGSVVDGTTAARPTAMTVLSLITSAPVGVDRLFRDLEETMPWVGEIAELAIWERALSASERQAVEDYLAVKYRPGVDPPQAGAPAFSPNGGLFTGSLTVTLTSTTPGAQIRYTLNGGVPDEASDLYTVPLELTATTVVTARTFAADASPSDIATVRFELDTGWSPASVSDLALWVSADAGLLTDGGDGVDVWFDRGSGHNDLVQPKGTLQPKVVRNAPGTFGGLPSLRFDGVNDALMLTTPVQGTLTAFAVLSQRSGASATYRSLFGATGSSSYAFFGGTSALWHPNYASTLVRNGQTWLNGQPVNGTSTARPINPSVLSIITQADNPSAPTILVDSLFQDADNNSPWDGDIAELLVYRRALTNDERKRVEDYLVEKYRPYTPRAAAPTLTPNGGAFAGPVTISLGTTTPAAELRYTLDGGEPDGASQLYAGPFELSTTTTVRAKAMRADLDPSATVTVTFLLPDGFRPSDLDGLSLWLRADAGVSRESGERVHAWANQAPPPPAPLAPNDAGYGTALGLPAVATSTYGGLPAMSFDGSDDYLLLTRAISDIRTVFWVVRQDAAAPATYRYLLGDATAAHFCGGTSSIWYAGGSASPYVTGGQTRLNGAVINATTVARPTTMSVLSLVTTGNVVADRLMRHAIYNGTWFGDLGELIVFNRALTAAEVGQVEQYLGARYGIVVQP